jgi:hypothetical protein
MQGHEARARGTTDTQVASRQHFQFDFNMDFDANCERAKSVKQTLGAAYV